MNDIFQIELKLKLQKIGLIFNDELKDKIIESQKVGENVFNIKVPLLLNKKKLPSNYSKSTYIGNFGAYDFKHDLIEIFSQRMQQFCQLKKIDFEPLFLKTICHELGHAKQARYFEQENIFQYRWRIFKTCPFAFKGYQVELNDVYTCGFPFYEQFMFGLNDYAIDKKLKEHGIVDNSSHVVVDGLQKSMIYYKNLNKNQQIRFDLESLLLMPLYVLIYNLSDLSQEKKSIIEYRYTKLVQEKWFNSIKIMDSIEFGKPTTFVDATKKMFKEILNLNFHMWPTGSEALFSKYKKIPKFWNKNQYNIFSLI